MDESRLLVCLESDHARLREAAAADPAAAVPTCPGWTVADLVRHVAEVYLHKVACMRLGRAPDNWPPDLSGEEPLAALDRAYRALVGEFAGRAPGDTTFTWYEPDRTVGFWIRRMAQETVIHRIDAELAAGRPVTPVPADLAVDGIDEVLTAFLAYASRRWPKELGTALEEASGRSVRVATDGGSWLVRMAPTGVDVDASDPASAVATVSGPPDGLLRWLWGRGGDGDLRLDGDREAISELRGLLAAATV